MRLFDDEAAKPTRSGADWEHHRAVRQPHSGPAQDEVGVLAMSSFTLARSSDVAVAIRGITAYSDGLLLHAAVLFADEQTAEALEWSLQEYSRNPGRFRLGIELPNGRKATTGTGDAPPVESPESGAVLTLQSSTAGLLQWHGDYWLWPVPEEGSMVVGCRWPDRAIDECLVAVDTEQLRHASETIKPIWLT